MYSGRAATDHLGERSYRQVMSSVSLLRSKPTVSDCVESACELLLWIRDTHCGQNVRVLHECDALRALSVQSMPSDAEQRSVNWITLAGQRGYG